MPDRDSAPPSDARLARRLAAGALAAELGHDLQGPLNLFRSMTERLEGGKPLDAEDAALLREELERLARLSVRLRELARHSLARGRHAPRELVERALGFSPALVGVELDLADDGLTVHCDGALVACALRELIDNALEARQSRAGLRWEAGDPPSFCVWDDGHGFAQDPGQAARFGVSSHAAAAGLGLTLALRVARAHGFPLDFARTGGLTEVRLSFVTPGGRGQATKEPG